MVDIKSAYGDKLRVCVDCKEKTKTLQHLKDQVDVNNIIDKFVKTGVLESSNRKSFFGDCTSDDYQECLNKVLVAQDSFESLSAKVKARFKNDPVELMQFLEDDKNRDEAVVLGLVNPKDVKPEVKPEVEVGNQYNLIY